MYICPIFRTSGLVIWQTNHFTKAFRKSFFIFNKLNFWFIFYFFRIISWRFLDNPLWFPGAEFTQFLSSSTKAPGIWTHLRQHLIPWRVLESDKYSQPSTTLDSATADFTFTDSTNRGWKLFGGKIPESFKKQHLNVHILAPICIAFTLD